MVPWPSRAGHRRASPSQKSLEWLETHAHTNLNVPRIVDLPFQRPEVPGVTQSIVGIKQLVVVEDVGEDGSEIRAETFGEHDRLLNTEVHVPEGLSAESASTAVMTVVNAEDRIAEAVVDPTRILIQRRTEAGRSYVGILGRRKRVVVSLTAASLAAANVDGVFQGANVAAVRLAEGLAATVNCTVSESAARIDS